MAPMSAQTLSSSCQKIWAFLFPQLTFVLLSSLWGRIRTTVTVILAVMLQGLSSGRPPFSQWALV